MWFNLDLIKNMVGFCKTMFPRVAYAYTTIPTYPGGHIGFLLCSLNPVGLAMSIPLKSQFFIYVFFLLIRTQIFRIP